MLPIEMKPFRGAQVWMHHTTMESVLIHCETREVNHLVWVVEMDNGRGNSMTLELRVDAEYFNSLGYEFVCNLEQPVQVIPDMTDHRFNYATEWPFPEKR